MQHLKQEGGLPSSSPSSTSGTSGKKSIKIIPDPGLCILTKIIDKKPYDKTIIRPKFLQRDELPRELQKYHNLFINVCTHKNVTGPKDAKGNDIVKSSTTNTLTTEELLNMEIPLAIGDIRRLSKDYYQTTSWVIDILIHPWIITHGCQKDKLFKENLCIFLSDCVADELSLIINSKDSKWESMIYVGGTKKGDKEIPIPFNPNRLQNTSSTTDNDSTTNESNKLAQELLQKLGKSSTNNTNGNKSSSSSTSNTKSSSSSSSSNILASTSSLLRAVENHDTTTLSNIGSGSSSSSPTSSTLEDSSTTLPELDGLRIKGLEKILNSTLNNDESNSQSNSKTKTIDNDATRFAEFAASIFPQQQLVYNGACTFQLDILNNNDDTSTNNNSIVAKIVFDGNHVQLSSLSLADLELDVTNTNITIRIHRSLLLQYKGLELNMVPILIQTLPITVNAEEVRAKYSRKLHQLTITLPVMNA